jgi:hypothetical protein
LKEIGDIAFQECEVKINLDLIQIPSNVQMIGHGGIGLWSSIFEVIFELYSHLNKIGGKFFEKRLVKSIQNSKKKVFDC